MLKSKHIHLIFIIIGIIGLVFSSGCISDRYTSFTNKHFNYTSIKDLIEYPNNYVDKNVTIKGILVMGLGGYGLQDKEGYWVWISDNCIEAHRNYNPNSTYTATGIWIKKELNPGTIIAETKYELKCTSSLE